MAYPVNRVHLLGCLAVIFGTACSPKAAQLERDLSNATVEAISVGLPLRTLNNTIVDAENNGVTLHGMSWFGFNSGTTMVDGLWNGTAMSSDFATVVLRQQLLGFNAVRLPFSFAAFSGTPNNYSFPCTVPSTQDVANSVLPPGTTTQNTPTGLVSPPSRTPGMCNSYLPNDSVFNRYVWVAQFYARNGFYVLLDDHFREDPTVLTVGTQTWAQDWAHLVSAVTQDPNTSGKIMVDILNEPDNHGLRWEPSGSNPGLHQLYVAAMDAITTVAPNTLFLVEGAAQGGIGANWGDGFSTDATLIQSTGSSDPSGFFADLATKSYAHQVVVSPHVYGPAVTQAAANWSGSGLFNRLSNSFGYLTQKGFCGIAACPRYPIAIGEFGSTFTAANDVTFMTDFASYLNNTGSGNDGRHETIGNWFYWDWNADSGDTGGLVANDWLSIQWTKVQYLTSLSLAPWYTGQFKKPVPPSTPVTVPAQAPVAPTPTPTAGSGCVVQVVASTPWQVSQVATSTVQIYVSTSSTNSISAPWTLELRGSYSGLQSAWNWTPSLSGSTVLGGSVASWQTLQANSGNNVNVGMVVGATTGNFKPTLASINGVACAIK